jgi:RelA/SpoT family (p)ppGpp synthetase
MNAATLIPPAPVEYAIEIPQWLQTCLDSQAGPRSAETIEPVPPEESTQEVDLICRAFQFAYALHQEQYRASGEPYIAHPVAVSGLLRDLGGTAAVVAAGFLHDVVEDTAVTPEEIETQFGAEVRELVEGVTKLSKFNFSSKTERQAENFRRMFLAMAQDIRVILVKLADRLHNMRTLEHLADEKRRRIALETREIFAPLANRLGIGRFKWELEDLSFKYLEPEAYREIQTLVAEKRTDREAYISRSIETLRERLDRLGIRPTDISGRPKHLYSIYRKMHRQNKEFHEIYDMAALRIITKTKDECYRALAVVHDAFRPIPGRFKDYIGLPKPNRYQSLHTSVIGYSGRPMEVQIRTLEMHQVAEYGIAAHWKYKESGGSTAVGADDEKFSWLRQLVEWQNDLKDSQEYLDNIRDGLFDEDVYVFTPKGDVIALARQATSVDFAYRIHTEVGNHCAGAKINGRIVPLDTRLKNGDIVEIITQKNAHPSMDWLNFVVSSGAKNRIRQWYKRSHRDENLARGRDMLEKELGKKGLESLLKSDPMKAVAERCNYATVEDLLAGLGYGEITLNLVVNRIRETVKTQQQEALAVPLTEESFRASTAKSLIPSSSSSSPILGIEGLVYRLAGCCNPLPGEPIIAAVSLGSRGISIHRQGCPNVEEIPGERLIPVSWNTNGHGGRPQTYPVRLQLEVLDRVGVMRDVLGRVSDNQINIRNAQVTTSHNKPAVIELCIEISNHEQLDRISCQLKQMSDVLTLKRVSGSVEDC